MTSSFWQPIQNSTYTLGEKVLINNGVFPHAFWYWLGVAALFGYMILFNTIYTLALTYLNRQYNLTPVTIIRWVPIFLCLFFQSGQFTLLLLFFTKKKNLFWMFAFVVAQHWESHRLLLQRRSLLKKRPTWLELIPLLFLPGTSRENPGGRRIQSTFTVNFLKILEHSCLLQKNEKLDGAWKIFCHLEGSKSG